MSSPNFLSRQSFLRIAKAGLTARAIVYALIALFLLKAALLPGSGDEGVSPQDAFSALETTGFGRAILLLIAVGLALYAFWRWTQAFADTADEGESAKGLLARAGMVTSGNSYALIGILAALTTFGQNTSSSGGGTTKAAVSWLLGQPFGTLLTSLAGLALVGIGIAQVWRVKTGQWRGSIRMNAAPGWVTPIIQFAIAGRGLLFVLVGLFVLLAGWTGQPSDAKGLAETLGWLRDQPFGLWLYSASALILLSYGVYSFTQARYTDIS